MAREDPGNPAPTALIDRYFRVVEAASQVLLFFGGVAIIALMLHICADVAGKHFFNKPITGTLEIVAWYYMVACVFLPLAFVQVQRLHLTVELFTMGLSRRRLAALDGVIAVLGLGYVALLAWLVYGRARAATADREILDLTFFDVPAWPSRWVLPLSFGSSPWSSPARRFWICASPSPGAASRRWTARTARPFPNDPA